MKVEMINRPSKTMNNNECSSAEDRRYQPSFAEAPSWNRRRYRAPFGLVSVLPHYSEKGTECVRLSMRAHDGPHAGEVLDQFLPVAGYGADRLKQFLDILIPGYKGEPFNGGQLIGKKFFAKVEAQGNFLVITPLGLLA